MSKMLLPPKGFTSWLDYAIETMDTRSLETEELLNADGVRRWPAGTTRADLAEAARHELENLRGQRQEASPDPALAKVALRQFMEYLSQDTELDASWGNGLDYKLWDAMQGSSDVLRIDAAELDTLRQLHKSAGGWWTWLDGVKTQVFVSTERWLATVAQHQQQTENE